MDGIQEDYPAIPGYSPFSFLSCYFLYLAWYLMISVLWHFKSYEESQLEVLSRYLHQQLLSFCQDCPRRIRTFNNGNIYIASCVNNSTLHHLQRKLVTKTATYIEIIIKRFFLSFLVFQILFSDFWYFLWKFDSCFINYTIHYRINLFSFNTSYGWYFLQFLCGSSFYRVRPYRTCIINIYTKGENNGLHRRCLHTVIEEKMIDCPFLVCDYVRSNFHWRFCIIKTYFVIFMLKFLIY